MKKYFLLAGLFLLIGCHSLCAQNQKKVNPLFESWASFNTGSALTTQTTSIRSGQTIGTTTQTQVLTKKTDHSLEFEITTSLAINGKPSSVKTKFKIEKFGKFNSSFRIRNIKDPKTSRGNETLTVDSNRYACQWTQHSGTLRKKKVVFKAWTDPKFPGLVVKQETTFGENLTRKEALKFDRK